MGVEVEKINFSQLEFSEFKNHLKKETAILMNWFKDKSFHCDGKKIGLELETWIVDKDNMPAPENEAILKALNDPLVVPELSKFNTEINAPPQDFNGSCFRNTEIFLNKIWNKIEKCSNELDLKMLMIGSLPTLRDDMLTMENMSSFNRYKALNDQVMRLREGKAVSLKIEGKESIEIKRKDIMLEAATTSLQIHFQSAPEDTKRYYNASIVASAFTAAVCANTPMFYGKELWDETRIPIFEQALDLKGFHNIDNDLVRRVSFGSGYIRNSPFECFLENLDSFPVLLPIIYDEGHEWLNHLRLHNGTIWRWNRPIIGINKDGTPSLRTEHRVPAAGPTVVDITANIAFYVGLIEYFANMETPIEEQISFHNARSNFYAAAKNGLSAEIIWTDGKSHDLQFLLYQEILPKIKEQFIQMDIDRDDIDYYISDIIEQRIRTGRTGSFWQRSFISTHGHDYQSLVQSYYENQQHGKPVAQWKL